MSNTNNNIMPLAEGFETRNILDVSQTDSMSGKYVLVNDGSGKPWVMPASLFFAAANQAEVAAREAEAAAGRVDSVVVEADQAAVAANAAASRASQAAVGVEKAITDANNAAGQAASAAESAGIAGGKASNAATAAENAATAAENAAVAASEAGENAEIATQNAESAAILAKEVADHPTYIGSDGFVYIWNTATKQYEKTNIYVKGDPFKITMNYTSVAEMEADHDNPNVPVGSYVMIKTGNEEDEDNLKVFLKNYEGFDYIGHIFGGSGGDGNTKIFNMPGIYAYFASPNPAIITLSTETLNELSYAISTGRQIVLTDTATYVNETYFIDLSLYRRDGQTYYFSIKGYVATGSSTDITTNGMGFVRSRGITIDMATGVVNTVTNNMVQLNVHSADGATQNIVSTYPNAVFNFPQNVLIKDVGSVVTGSRGSGKRYDAGINANTDVELNFFNPLYVASVKVATVDGTDKINVRNPLVSSQHCALNNNGLDLFSPATSANGGISYLNSAGNGFLGFIGARITGDTLNRLFLGWGNDPTNVSNQFYVSESGIRYKNVDVALTKGTTPITVIENRADTQALTEHNGLGIVIIPRTTSNLTGLTWRDPTTKADIAGVSVASNPGFQYLNLGWGDNLSDVTKSVRISDTKFTYKNKNIWYDGLTGIVNTAAIADKAVTYEKMAAGAIGYSNIKDGVVGSSKLINEAVTNAKLADNSVGTSKIQSGAVTNLKLATASVDALQIVDNAVISSKIKNAAVTKDKLASNSVWTEQLSDGAVSVIKMSAEAQNGLVGSADKTKLSRLRSYTTATTVANLDVNYEEIEVTLGANASLSVNAVGAAYNGFSITATVYCAAARTITIPTSGSYRSMCGSSYTCPAGKWVEFNLKCLNGIWHIAKLEQE